MSATPSTEWRPTIWERPMIDHISPRVVGYHSLRTFDFYIHDHTEGARILVMGSAPTLVEAQVACDAALAAIIAQRSDEQAIAVLADDGAPEQAGS